MKYTTTGDPIVINITHKEQNNYNQETLEQAQESQNVKKIEGTSYILQKALPLHGGRETQFGIVCSIRLKYFNILYISTLPYLVLMHTRCITPVATQLRGIEVPYITPKDQFWGVLNGVQKVQKRTKMVK